VNNKKYAFYGTKQIELDFNSVAHRSMLADLAMAFNYRFEDCQLSYEEKIPVDGTDIRSDLVVRTGKYVFIVELEKSLTPLQIFENKIKRYEKMKRKGEFKSAIVLFAFAPRIWDFSWRPLEYCRLGAEIAKSKESVQELIRLSKGCKYYYRFMSFHDFNKIHQSVWFRPDGQRCRLIN